MMFVFTYLSNKPGSQSDQDSNTLKQARASYADEDFKMVGNRVSAFEGYAPYFLLAVLGIFDRDSPVESFISHPKAPNRLLATVNDLLEIVR
jgi:hypothetical protein